MNKIYRLHATTTNQNKVRTIKCHYCLGNISPKEIYYLYEIISKGPDYLDIIAICESCHHVNTVKAIVEMPTKETVNGGG